jgi:hypothetical protein
MLKKEIYNEIEQTFGLVPSMFKTIPDSSLELEWKLFKQVQLEEGPIPDSKILLTTQLSEKRALSLQLIGLQFLHQIGWMSDPKGIRVKGINGDGNEPGVRFGRFGTIDDGARIGQAFVVA